MRERIHLRVAGIPRWQMLLAAAVAAALGLALFLLTIGLFILILPVALVAGALYYFFGPWRAARDARSGSSDFIETEYRVIERDRDDPERGG